MKDDKKNVRCSFCNKSAEQVRKLIAGTDVYICDECVALCNDIIGEEVEEYSALPELGEIPKPKEIYDILSQMINNKDVSVIRFRDYIAKQISCKSSIKANHKINRLEIDALIDNLNKCENPYTCPHGRPTMVKYSKYELERFFKRA